MNKKTIVLASICGVLIVLMIILSLIKNTTDDSANRLDDSKTFFEINNLINEVNKKDNSMYSYLSTDIYYKENGLITTYFVTGFSLLGSMDLQYTDNVSYLLKIKGITYSIERLNGIDNIQKYANNYIEEETDLDSDLTMPTFVHNEKNKLVYYLTIFNYLLHYNPDKAYNYLTDEQKQDYGSEIDFKNNAKNIINNISTYIDSYTTDKKGNETIYTINTEGKSRITIYESGAMNFKIDY